MDRNKRLTRWDILALAIILVIYSVISFVNLGDTAVPETQPDLGSGEKKEYITYILLEEKTALEELLLFKGLGTCGVTVYKSDDNGESWVEIARQLCDEIYVWETIPLDASAQLLCLSIGGDAELEVFEAAFRSAAQETLTVITDDCLLFDEQELVPDAPSYLNGTYFDESYHARTAYEHTQNIRPYEISHPPFGKLLISVGIKLFGMNPFGWRVVGNIFGILMLVVMYVFAKRLFGRTYWAVTATLFLTLDFMHFTQTRIALIDSFAVFFILLMYYLMYLYYDSTVEELPQNRSLILLAGCGVVFGLGIASKWIAVYGGIGLAAVFFLALFRRRKAGEKSLKTCLWCVLFFVIVPLAIYFASYIPYYLADPDTPAWKIFFENQVYMLRYHGGLETRHTFESKWYTWPLILRPMWYYGAKELAYEGLCSTIVALGNPIVWWCGSAAATVLLLKRKKERKEWFILIGLLSQYLPWALIGRSTFIYHFFASVPFVILALTAVLKMVSERYRIGRLAAPVLLCGAAVLFVLFYPVLSGYLADRGYVLNLLTWFDSWTLCY